MKNKLVILIDIHSSISRVSDNIHICGNFLYSLWLKYIFWNFVVCLLLSHS